MPCCGGIVSHAYPLIPVIWRAATGGTVPDAYSHWPVNTVIVVLTVAIICACVLLHYEVLNVLSRQLLRLAS